MFKYKLYIFFVLAVGFFMSCDVIENPVKEQDEETCGDETLPVPIRKILAEEFTGQRCNGCPAAAEELHDIIETYCDRIVPLAVHIGGFAAPSGDFTADYRTEAGNALDDYYNIGMQGLPSGAVSRCFPGEETVLRKDEWRTYIHEMYQTVSDADIGIVSDYDSLSRQVDVTLTVNILNDIDEAVTLGLYLSEDSIVSPQLTPTGTVYDYVHMHMLRKAYTDAFGDELAASAKAGDTFTKQFSFEADTAWRVRHCDLVAFIAKAESKEIIQAESEPVIQD